MNRNAETSKERRIRCIESGLCIVCGKNNDRIPRQVCSTCNEKKKAAQRKYTKKLRDNNLCTMCREPLDRKGVYCTNCVEIVTESSNNTLAKYLYEGICASCKKSLDREGVLCIKCNEKQKKYKKKHRKKKLENTNK